MGKLFNFKKEKTEETPEARAKRSNMLQMVCAVYLLYLVYQMITSVMNDSLSGTELYCVIAACVVFSAVALVILFFTARRSIRNFKASVDAMESLEAEEAAASNQEDEDDFLEEEPADTAPEEEA